MIAAQMGFQIVRLIVPITTKSDCSESYNLLNHGKFLVKTLKEGQKRVQKVGSALNFGLFL